MPTNMMPNQVNIAAATQGNVNGGRTVSYAVSYANVPALVVTASATLKLVYAQRQLLIDHVIYITASVVANVGDIVQYGSKNFWVRGVLDPSGTGRIYELHCQEATTEIIIEE